MASRRFGVLAEDETDANVLKVIIRRTLGAHVPVKAHAGRGCATLRNKAESWIDQLTVRGFREIIVLHDRDSRDEGELRRQLEAIAVPREIDRHICIPVEELEAWFWADPKVIQKIGRGSGSARSEPHRLPNPKEALERLSRDVRGRPRYTTQENEALAEVLNMKLCASRCPSFQSLLHFLIQR